MSASVRPASTAERAIGSERKRSNRPGLQVGGEPERRGEAAEGDVLDHDARDQEVRVAVEHRRHGDRAAEHVDEQQHEHDRLDRERGQNVRLADDPDQVALGENERVGKRSRSLLFLLFSPWPSCSAAWPVSEMKTSSSVGRRTAMSSTSTPA